MHHLALALLGFTDPLHTVHAIIPRLNLGLLGLFVALARYLLMKESEQLKYLNYYESRSWNLVPKKQPLKHF